MVKLSQQLQKSKLQRIEEQSTQTKISQQILTKDQIAEQQRQQIDQRISELQLQKQELDEKYNQAKTISQAESYDQQRTFAETQIEALRQSKQYATGEYTIESIFSYATQRASAKYERVQPLSVLERRERQMEQLQREAEYYQRLQEQEGENLVITKDGVYRERELYPSKSSATKQDVISPSGEVYYLDFEKVAEPSYFPKKETINTQPRTEFRAITPDKPTETGILDYVGKVTSISKIYNKLPSSDFYFNIPDKIVGVGGIVGIGSVGLITPYKADEGSISLKELGKISDDFIIKTQQDLFNKEITRTGLKSIEEGKAQLEYQARFERGYEEKILSGEITFEKAVEEYEQSDEAKIIQRKYEKGIEEGRKGKFTKEGFEIAGLSLARLGIKLIPKTTKGLVVEAGLIYTGSKILKAIPSSAVNLATFSIGTTGVLKAISPKSSPEEKAGGVITAGISFGALGIQGIKYLRRPTIRTAEIPSPKQTLRASETIGRDVTITTEKGVMNKVLYQEQKLSQTGIAGRRTIVSTKFRDLTRLKPVYEGVPYVQRSIKTSFPDIFGRNLIYSSESGYQKALKLLTKRGGYTISQAKTTLRYIQPRVIEQYLEKGSLTIKGSTAKGEFTYLTKQPVLTIDKTLGIKTRGARSIKDLYEIERKIINIREREFVLEKGIRTSVSFEKGYPVDFKAFEISKGVMSGKFGDIEKGYELLKSDIKGLTGYKEVETQSITGLSFNKKLYPSDNILKVDLAKTRLIKDYIDLTNKRYYTAKGIKKTPLSKTFQADTSKVVQVKDILKQADNLKTSLKTADILKTSVSPSPVAVRSQIKNLVKLNQKLESLSSVGLKGVSLSKATSIKGLTKSSVTPKLNVNNILKQIIRGDQVTKVKQSIATAQRSALKTSQVLRLERSLTHLPTFSAPIIRVPSTPTLTPPSTPIIPLFFPSQRTAVRTRTGSKSIQELAYLPDFTSKILGLEAETISERQATKKIKEILTGFEVRRPVKVRKR